MPVVAILHQIVSAPNAAKLASLGNERKERTRHSENYKAVNITISNLKDHYKGGFHVKKMTLTAFLMSSYMNLVKPNISN